MNDTLPKTCSKCGKEKPESEFHRRGSRRDAQCKSCVNTQQRERYRKNPESSREYSRRYRESHPEKMARINKDWVAKNPDRSRNNKLRHMFGITFGQYAELLAAQNGKCVVCGRDQNDLRRALEVDHDHLKSKGDAGYIRGLLCGNCNMAIGLIHDNSAIAFNIFEYLSGGRRDTMSKLRETLARIQRDIQSCQALLDEVLATTPSPGKTHLDVLCERLDEAKEKLHEKQKN